MPSTGGWCWAARSSCWCWLSAGARRRGAAARWRDGAAERMTVLAARGAAKSLRRRQGRSTACRFAVEAGELLALIGPNGAGKTTCFNMLNGQLRPDAGRVALAGRDITGLAPRRIWRLGVGRTFQITATFASMTVRENVQMALLSHQREAVRASGRAARRRHVAEADALLEPGRHCRAGRTGCGVLAYGDLKRVELAMALANAPKLLLMDEPTAGMAPRERIALMELTAASRASGASPCCSPSTTWTSCSRTPTASSCSIAAELIAEGNADDVRADPRVQDVYLGSRADQRRRTDAEGREAPQLLRPRAHPCGVSLRARGRRGGGAARPQWRRQIDHHEIAHGSGAPAPRPNHVPRQDIAGMRAASRSPALGIGYVPEDRRIFPELTVDGNLEVGRRPAREARRAGRRKSCSPCSPISAACATAPAAR